jgi:glucosamine--fructose-6-phosphate aminotransferase (isomerizing)
VCGIIGIANRSPVELDVLLDALERLEYRGYDSAGVAYLDDGLSVTKRSGDISRLRDALADVDDRFRFGIAHTRWSTHGAPTESNAHPHTDASGRVAVVHNGIIENHDALRRELRSTGVEFTSETDSEVVPHLVAHYLDRGANPREAFEEAVGRLYGSYALCALVEGQDTIFVARRASPLAVGIDETAHYVASDVPAFLEHTRDVAYLQDGQRATVTPAQYRVWNAAGEAVSPEETTIEWTVEQTEKGGFDHFLLKEIDEQPGVIDRTLRDRVTTDGRLTLERMDVPADPDIVHLVGCGTSYHACLYGAYLFRRMGVPAFAHRGSEYGTIAPPDSEVDTELVVGVTQSGETADILGALDRAKEHGRSTLVLTNTLGSTAIRTADDAYTIQAGPEVSVAATKTFTADLIALNLLAEYFTTQNHRRLLRTFSALPEWIRDTIDDSTAPDLAEQYADSDAVFYLGRGLSRPIALEGALKLKEISYKHAEGFGTGELKHGPLALVTERTPVIALLTGDAAQIERIRQNVSEVAARGAPLIALVPDDETPPPECDHVLTIPDVPQSVEPILANVHLQLFAYHVANRLDRPIDQPRNLAKSVTVR